MASANAARSSTPSSTGPDVVYLLGAGIHYVLFRRDADEAANIRCWPTNRFGEWPIREIIDIPDHFPDDEPIQLVMQLRERSGDEDEGSDDDFDDDVDGPIAGVYDYLGQAYTILFYSNHPVLVESNSRRVRYWGVSMRAQYGIWPFDAENAGGADQTCVDPALLQAQAYQDTDDAEQWIQRH